MCIFRMVNREEMNNKCLILMTRFVLFCCLSASACAFSSSVIAALESEQTFDYTPYLGTLDKEHSDYLRHLNITESAMDGFIQSYANARQHAVAHGMNTDAFDFYIFVASILRSSGVGQVHFKSAFNHSYMNLIRDDLAASTNILESRQESERSLWQPLVPENYDKYEYYPAFIMARVEHLLGRMNIGYRRDEIKMQPISWSFGRTPETLDIIQNNPIDRLGGFLEKHTGNHSLLQSSLGDNRNFFRGIMTVVDQQKSFDSMSAWMRDKGIVLGAGGVFALSSNLNSPLENSRVIFNQQLYGAIDLQRAIGVRGLKVGFAFDQFTDLGLRSLQLFDPLNGNAAPKLVDGDRLGVIYQRSISANYRLFNSKTSPLLQFNYRRFNQNMESNEIFGLSIGMKPMKEVILQFGSNWGTEDKSLSSVSLTLFL